MKTGLVLEGGGLRGIFTAGILDVLMEEGITFDGAVGVSAGAAFGCNYKSGQNRRAYRYNMRFAKDPRYSSVRSLVKTGDLFNAQFCYHDIPEKLFPFDWDRFRNNPMEFYVVCTDVETGKAVYHLCGDEDTWEMLEWFRASGSMPLVSRVVEVGGYKLLDGGVSDSIPLRFMEEQGYERNLVILTRPADYRKGPNPVMPLMRRALREYPAAVRAIEDRHLVYNETLAYIRKQEAEGSAFVLRPARDLDIGRIEHDRDKIRKAYKEGRLTARRLLPEIRRFLGLASAVPAAGKASAGGASESTQPASGPAAGKTSADGAAEGTQPVSGPAAGKTSAGGAAEHTQPPAGAREKSSPVEDPELINPFVEKPVFEEPVFREHVLQEDTPAGPDTGSVVPQEEADAGMTVLQKKSDSKTEVPADCGEEAAPLYAAAENRTEACPGPGSGRRHKGCWQKKTWKPGRLTVIQSRVENRDAAEDS